MDETPETLLAVWKRNCWKCGESGTVVLDVSSWSFGLRAEDYTLWKDDIPSQLLEVLGQGANIQFRRTNAVREGYYANVCGRCGATQGDFYLSDEFQRFLAEESPQGFELVLIRNGVLERRFRSVPEASAYFWGRDL